MRVTGREEVVVQIPGGKPISLPLMFQQPTKKELKKAEQAKAGKDSAREVCGGVLSTSPSDTMGGDGMEVDNDEGIGGAHEILVSSVRLVMCVIHSQ